MIFDGSISVAQAAAGRWEERSHERAGREGRTSAEIETPARIQKRLDRLAHSAAKAASTVSSGDAVELMLPAALDTIGFERVIGDPDFQGIAFLEKALAVSRFVARIHVRGASRQTAGFGTGFMVSPRLLITNNHVLATAAAARWSEAEFDFQNDRNQRPLAVVPFALQPDVFFHTDVDLDYTLVAVAERSTGGATLQPYGWSRLIADEGKALLGDPLNIIQHPKGQAKQIVFRSNRLIDLPSPFAHYTTDTEPGSSGSPVYNDQWELVALHHSGVPRRDSEGRMLRKDGVVWRQGVDDPDDLDWVANEGVRISFIAQAIEKAELSVAASLLRRDLLDLEPPDPVAAMIRSEAEGDGSVSVGGKRRNGDSSVVLEIPLRIHLSLGETGGVSATISTSRDVAPSPTPVMPLPDARLALAELERARSRTYYDGPADRAARNAYWGDFLSSDQDPAEFFDAISRHLEETHLHRPAYRPAQHLYPWIDLRPGANPSLRSVYSGKSLDPRQLIQEEIAAEAMASLGQAETNASFNCEHVVPQSWFGAREPMRGDLHHLFTCESRCNSFRSNTAYFDFPEFAEAVRDDCGKSEADGFEPAAGKGAVSRATLYFLLRYAGQVNELTENIDASRLRFLLTWHERYPPDEWELHRNAAISEKQGNRNPLIDFPQWAGRIAFERGL